MRVAMQAWRGEFHTCVCAGPMFAAPLPLETGEIVTRERFVFADFLIPAAGAAASCT
jgi:diphthamide synthase (EF-2-diphthine--ammonia ligase)